MAEEIENCYGRETELSERARDYLVECMEECIEETVMVVNDEEDE